MHDEAAQLRQLEAEAAELERMLTMMAQNVARVRVRIREDLAYMDAADSQQADRDRRRNMRRVIAWIPGCGALGALLRRLWPRHPLALASTTGTGVLVGGVTVAAAAAILCPSDDGDDQRAAPAPPRMVMPHPGTAAPFRPPRKEPTGTPVPGMPPPGTPPGSAPQPSVPPPGETPTAEHEPGSTHPTAPGDTSLPTSLPSILPSIPVPTKPPDDSTDGAPEPQRCWIAYDGRWIHLHLLGCRR